MNGITIFILAVLGFIIILLALTVMYVVPVKKAKIISKNEEVYQKQAADAIEAQKETAHINDKLVIGMEEVKEQLASIERILKEVE